MEERSSILTNKAKSILAEAKIRETSIRVLVLREILACECAFTLIEMEERIPTMDRSTLCRTLNLFHSRGILHEVDNGSGHKMYCRCVCSARHERQIHFTCLSCHKTYCIRSLMKEDVDAFKIPHLDNFEVFGVSYVLKGLCPKCKNKVI